MRKLLRIFFCGLKFIFSCTHLLAKLQRLQFVFQKESLIEELCWSRDHSLMLFIDFSSVSNLLKILYAFIVIWIKLCVIAGLIIACLCSLSIFTYLPFISCIFKRNKLPQRTLWFHIIYYAMMVLRSYYGLRLQIAIWSYRISSLGVLK